MATSTKSFDEMKWAFAMDKASEILKSDFSRAIERLSKSGLEVNVWLMDRKIYNGEYDVDAARTASYVYLSVLLWGGPLFGGKIYVKRSSLFKKLSVYVSDYGFVLHDTTDQERMLAEHTFCFKIALPGVKISSTAVDISPVVAEPVSVPVSASAPVRIIGDVPVAKKSTMGLPGLSLAVTAPVTAPMVPPPTQDEWHTVGAPVSSTGKLSRKDRRAAAKIAAPVAVAAAIDPVAQVADAAPVAVAAAAPVSVPQVAVAAQTFTMTGEQLSELLATTVRNALAKLAIK